MSNKTFLIILTVLVVITLAISAGCTSPSGPTQASSNQVSQSLAPTTRATTAQVNNDFSQVTHAEVSTIHAHWTSGAEYDGITVHPDLRDVKDQTVKWSGVALPVDITIYTTKFDKSYNRINDKLVYQGTGTISNWQDGNMFMGGGIQVPYSSMKVPAGESYGVIYVTVHTPDGKTYAAKDTSTALTP